MTEHLPIQRWTKIFTRYPASELLPNENGEYVTYDDHLAALRDCEERMLNAARESVEVLLKEWWEIFEGKPEDLKELKSMVELNRAIAAIDALKEDR